MDAGHSDNEQDAKEEASTRNNDHRDKQRDTVESSDESSGQGINERIMIEEIELYLSCCAGLGSDTLEKLRGRSRSELPSPESEDISRRRDSRKDQRQAISGLSSLAKIYADDETAETNKQSSSPKPEGESTKSTDAAGSHAKDNQQVKTDSTKETSEKEKDKQRVRMMPLFINTFAAKSGAYLMLLLFRTVAGVVPEKGAILGSEIGIIETRIDDDIGADLVNVHDRVTGRAEIAITEEEAGEAARGRMNENADNARIFSLC